MKKLLLLFLLSTFAVNAQLREKGGIEVIPEIGYTSAIYRTDDPYITTAYLNSAGYGVVGDYYFNNRWSLHSGLQFQTMGTDLSDGTYRYVDKLNYLNIPVNANWHFGSTRKWNLNFGLTPGFLLSAKENGTDIKDLAQTFQLGLSFGIGYKLEITKKFSLLMDYQYFYGMSNIRKDGGNLYNAMGSFNLGGVFYFK